MNIIDLETCLEEVIAEKHPTMIWGGPGLGKSSILQQISKRNEIPLVDLRLTLYEPVDLRGAMYIRDNRTHNSIPSILPDPDDEGFGILFLDELSSAVPLVQTAAFQLVLDRRIGDYQLPENWAVVAAGNRKEDRSVVFSMPKPLENRFTHLTLDPDLPAWKVWAYKNNISEMIIAFLTFKEECFYKLDLNSSAFPTPRSWEAANRIESMSLNESQKLSMIAGTVGEGTMQEYNAFKSVKSRLPNIDDIMNGRSYNIVDDLSVIYTITSTLIGNIKRIPDKQRTDNLVLSMYKYIEHIDSPEIKTATLREISTHTGLKFFNARNKAIAEAYAKLDDEIKDFIVV